jgi:hippurate hydrolase
MRTITSGPSILADAERVLPEVIELRRALHRIPEIGLHLPLTQAAVVDAVRGLGLTPVTGSATTSVTATIEGARPGPTILLRADMDGLPLQEDTGLPFASGIDGRMHACGHDTHVAMLVGAARLLLERRDALAGRVLLMFQPGEEGYHGARVMLEEGLLGSSGGDPPSAAFALHISTRYPTGTLNLRPGALLASADRFEVTIRGRGGHASSPHLAVDPITVAAELVIALQVMVTRRVDVFDPAVLTIGRLAAGTTNNIIPEVAVLEGTIRAVSGATRAAMHERLRTVVAGVCAAHGAAGEVVIDPGYPVTVCDGGFTALASEVCAEVAGAGAVVPMDAPIMGAEDFSYVLERVPGAMVFLGARPPDQDLGTAPQNHSNRVVFHEPALATGVAVTTAIALRVLGGA